MAGCHTPVIVSKRLTISSDFFLGREALLIPHYGCEILTGKGACHSGGLRNFLSDKAEQWQCCNKKLSWCWQTRATQIVVSQGHQTYSTIPYVRYSFLLCNGNFDFKRRRFYDIRLQNCRDLENWVSGPSRSLEMSPLDKAHMTSYWRSIVTMALSRVISEIFTIENVVTLKLGSEVTRGHWKLYRSVDRVWFPISVL